MTATDVFISASPDPETAAFRYERLLADGAAAGYVDALADDLKPDFFNLLAYSDFAYQQFHRYPVLISRLGYEAEFDSARLGQITDLAGLRRYKYEQLLRICWMDISNRFDYGRILALLSRLADAIINRVVDLSSGTGQKDLIRETVSVFALGKLGASELNFSSDIDLIITCINEEDTELQLAELQSAILNFVRRFSRNLEDREEHEFLYRVDLKLRPWGASGPLFMSIDETENYYEASSEAWERLAWLRGRCIAGNRKLGDELLQRLHPFIFMRSLSTDDLDRFLQIKSEMARARKRRGQWHVKTGAGGIRDIEFFIQILQLVNAATHKELQQTNTLEALAGLQACGFIDESTAIDLRQSYLFLRKLENRLQLRQEQQTHALPDDARSRLVLAKSLGVEGDSNDQILDNFETLLFANQNIARQTFEKILPAGAL